MKKTRIISLLLIVCLLLACAACGGGKTETESSKAETGESTTQAPDETDTEASTEEVTEAATEAPAETTDTDDETDPAAISEAAMENFLKKLDTCNYVVSGGDGPTTNVVSSEQAYIVYGDEEEYAETFVFMSLNGETFQAVIEGLGDVEDVEFISTDSVIDCMGEILPNNWMEISGGNMWELFYNDTEKPLEFTSTNEYVKRTLGALGGFGQFSLDRMQEVHMILDAKDPQSVHFTAVVEDAPPVIYDDLDLMLEFGKADDNSKVKQWLEAPVYPDARTAWTRDDIDTLDVVYMRNYGEQILPFPAASSYAMVFDKDAYRDFTGFLLTDAHFTEKDVEDYKEQLLDFGYTEETGTLIDGSTATVYRKLLREEYRAYAQLYLEYDNGLAVLGTLYHDLPEYEGLEAVSAAVQEYGFAALPDTDILTGWTTRDAAAAITESWAYYFDYDFNITLTLDYTDRDSAKAYLEDYKNKLIENGFVDRFNPGEDNGSCATADDLIKFRYTWGYNLQRRDQILL